MHLPNNHCPKFILQPFIPTDHLSPPLATAEEAESFIRMHAGTAESGSDANAAQAFTRFYSDSTDPGSQDAAAAAALPASASAEAGSDAAQASSSGSDSTAPVLWDSSESSDAESIDTVPAPPADADASAATGASAEGEHLAGAGADASDVADITAEFERLTPAQRTAAAFVAFVQQSMDEAEAWAANGSEAASAAAAAATEPADIQAFQAAAEAAAEIDPANEEALRAAKVALEEEEQPLEAGIVRVANGGFVELCIALVGTKCEMLALPGSLMLRRGGGPLSASEKVTPGRRVALTPPPSDIVPANALLAARGAAELTANALGVRGVLTIDVLVNTEAELSDGSHPVIVLDLNMAPSFAAGAPVFAQAAAHSPRAWPDDVLRGALAIADSYGAHEAAVSARCRGLRQRQAQLRSTLQDADWYALQQWSQAMDGDAPQVEPDEDDWLAEDGFYGPDSDDDSEPETVDPNGNPIEGAPSFTDLNDMVPPELQGAAPVGSAAEQEEAGKEEAVGAF